MTFKSKKQRGWFFSNFESYIPKTDKLIMETGAKYFNKLVKVRCTKCGKNTEMTDHYIEFCKNNDVSLICDTCRRKGK